MMYVYMLAGKSNQSVGSVRGIRFKVLGYSLDVTEFEL